MGTVRGDRIKSLRLVRKLTQGQLAAFAGSSQPHISSIEAGKQKTVGSTILRGLARVLDTNVDYLIGASDDPRPVNSMNLAVPDAKRRLIDKILVLTDWETHPVEALVDSLLGPRDSSQ